MQIAESTRCDLAFQHLANLLLKARPIGYDKHMDIPPGKNGSHQPGSLNRNRAAILFHMLESDICIGGDWLGVSGERDFHVAGSDGIKILRSKDGAVDIREILQREFEVNLNHHFQPSDSKRGLCSEVAVINALSHYLNERYKNEINQDPAPKCDLYLLTERVPCYSCSKLLSDFLQEFKNTSLHMGYMFDINTEAGEYDVDDFLRKVNTRAFAYKIQTVSSSDKGYAGLGESSAWRPEGVGSYSWFEASEDAQGGHTLHMVQVEKQSGMKVKPPDLMPSREPGQHSVHFTVKISPSGKNEK